MMKILHILFIFLVLGTMCGRAQKQVVWNEPSTEYGNYNYDGYFSPSLTVTRVELKPDETVVYVTLSLRSEYPRMRKEMLAKDAHLLAECKRYAVLKVDEKDHNVELKAKNSTTSDFVYHFQPLPMQTKSFDWICGENSAFQIKGIQPVEERWNCLFPSYWLDEKTGEWVIAFFQHEGCAIYANKIWTMKVTENRGRAVIFLERDGEKLDVLVGKNKKGRRTIQIGKEKRNLVMMTSRFLPDYPTKDNRTGFLDTGYLTDTVTIIGWLKDMPEHIKGECNFNVQFNEFVFNQVVDHKATLDSAGRFSIKIPLVNTSEAFLDWGRSYIHTVLEPGKTYFLLYDFKEGRRVFMGDDVRFQNELLKNPIRGLNLEMKSGDDFDVFLTMVDSTLRVEHAYVDQLCQQHPTLSARFVQFCKDNITAEVSFVVGQSRFNASEFKLPERVRQYAYEHFWTKMSRPYTLHRDWRGFIRDYADDIVGTMLLSNSSVNIYDYIEDFASNAEELAFLRRMKAWAEETNALVTSMENMEERDQIAKKINQENEAMIERMNHILASPKAQDVIGNQWFIREMQHWIHVLDSLGTDSFVKNAILCSKADDYIENKSKPLARSIMDSLVVWTSNSPILKTLRARNDFYHALAERKFDHLVLNTNPGVEGMKEGQEILNKLTKPYRGKFILLDVWGTWCGPCKQALSRSAEEYERLAPYDLQYMYLANNSPKDTWEAVIKMHHVTGDNVVHFNLPHEQQQAVEDFLKVKAFPTYKLLDPQGRVLDVKVDPRNLDALERLLKQLTGK